MNKYCLIFILLLSIATTSFAQTPSTYWWNDAVFYEVFVRSFKDNNGDGQGDLQGLMNKLDYLNDGNPSTHNDLGVTAIWLMPIQQSPSYHGYDVTDYRTVEQDYGSNTDFTNFITEAHNRGIKVIIDYVMNHTSSQHPWFTDALNNPTTSLKRDWYIWADPLPTDLGPWGQQVWYTKNGNQNYFGIFWSEMPDLNYRTAEVKTEMFDVARFWLQDMNVDGFRLDAARYLIEDGATMEDTPETISFWKDFRAEYKSIKPDAFAVGEAWATTDIVVPYVGTDGLDFCFEFDLASSILSAVNTASVAGLKTQMDKVVTAYPYLQYGTFLTNHDMNRAMSQLGNNTANAKLAANLLLTLPGVPYIYYGEEIGMTGSGADENKRTPFQWNNTSQAGFTSGTPWRNVNSDYTVKNVEEQQVDANSLWTNYNKLISIRNNQTALRRGDYEAITSSASTVYSFLRQYQAENIVVVSNLGAGALSNVQISSTNGSIVPGNYQLVELQGGGQIAVTIDGAGNFTNVTIPQIPAKGTLIYKLMNPLSIPTTVTFEVDMNAMITSGDFLVSESVDIVADFNNFGASSTTVLTDGNADGIYTVTISNLDVGSKINYKYRINAKNDGREEFANSAYLRAYYVVEGTNTVLDVYQKNTTTGVEANNLKHDFTIYPVPTNNELFVHYSPSYTGVIQYRITDMLGTEKLSSSFDLSSHVGQYSLPYGDLSNGIYLLSFTYEGKTEVFRIIIQK